MNKLVLHKNFFNKEFKNLQNFYESIYNCKFNDNHSSNLANFFDLILISKNTIQKKGIKLPNVKYHKHIILHDDDITYNYKKWNYYSIYNTWLYYYLIKKSIQNKNFKYNNSTFFIKNIDIVTISSEINIYYNIYDIFYNTYLPDKYLLPYPFINNHKNNSLKIFNKDNKTHYKFNLDWNIMTDTNEFIGQINQKILCIENDE